RIKASCTRVEPAVWGQRGHAAPEWLPLVTKVHPDIPVTVPKTPAVVKAGGVEVVTLSTKLDPTDAGHDVTPEQGGAFLGMRAATMNSDGNLYLLQPPVARLVIDRQGRIQRAEPAIHQTLSGFTDIQSAPPGDRLQSNKKTPFVWAEGRY